MTDAIGVVSPRGTVASVHVRPDTNDAATLHSTFVAPSGQVNDEYRLSAVHLRPDDWALDVGAHIGSVALALAIDNPCRIIAIEAVPDNVRMLRLNVDAIGAADRIHVVGEAAGAEGQTTGVIRYGYRDIPGITDEHAQQVRYIGNLFRDAHPDSESEVVPCVSLSGILDRFGVDEVAFTKIDAEGAEWAFLASPAIARLRVIVGEWHDGPASRLIDLLGPTHDVEILEDHGGIGLFRATRRHP